jgi:hypothetical protein
MVASSAERLRARASAMLVCILATATPARCQTVPSGCTDISSVPPIYSGIQYGAAIQGTFDNFLTNGGSAGCTDCHTSAGGTPAGYLDLDDGVSYLHLLNVPSYENASLFYVVPNHPEQSLLFQKINCDTPAVGVRMPFGFPSDTLSPELQALIYDWIAEGAPVGTTDGIFRNGFDLRGFAQ